MTATRLVAGLMFTTILGSTFMLSQASDLAVLQRVGRVTAEQVKAGLPPVNFAQFHPGDALPLEERVRLRIRTDKDLDGASVSIHVTDVAGQIKLKGIVAGIGQKVRAIELAEKTTGVAGVIDELAVPDAR